MTRVRSVVVPVLILPMLIAASACGGGSPSQPSGSGSSGSGTGGNTTPSKGTLTAVIDGRAYTGIVKVVSRTDGYFGIAATNAALTLTVSFATTRPAVGTTTVADSLVSMGVATTNGSSGATTGSWIATNISGSGSLTISTLTSSGATGTFNFTAAPAPPPSNVGATGTKVVSNGVFNVTF